MFIKYGILAVLFVMSSGCASLFKVRSCDPSSLSVGPSDFRLSVTKYGDSTKTPKSLIILPPTGGTNYIDKSYAQNFCSKGYDVYILNSWPTTYGTKTDLEIHQDFYAEGTRAVALLTDGIESPFIGLLGTSVGALHASVAAALNKRLNAVFLIVGGAPISRITVKSSLPALIQLNADRKKRYGFKSDDEVIAGIDQVFHFETMTLGSLYKSKDLGMVIATEDTTVPTEDQLRLKDYWQPKTVIYISANHFWGIVRAWLFHNREILDFFEESEKSRSKAE